jgi:phosphoribosylamine--glycine ligase
LKILIVGSGGRENAIAWKTFFSPSFQNSGSKMYCAPGSPGTSAYAESVNIKADDIQTLLEFALTEKIDFTIVGPEVPLALGITDLFEKNGLKIFGPSQNAARIESSKIFTKDLMKKHGVPTAAYSVFTKQNISEFGAFASSSNYPLVIKADGLAAGKGVVIAETREEALRTAKEFTEDSIFGSSGWSFVAEEFLQGSEASIFIITDGDDYVILPSSQDHKRILDGDKGKNTGGMGAYAPVNTLVTEDVLYKVKEKVISPVLEGLKQEGSKFKGCLYCGLMISPGGEPYVIEFNCRFGDPETQAVLPLIESDFLELLLASAGGRIKDYSLSCGSLYSCCIVMASEGYPDEYEKGKQITGLDKISEGCLVFHSGTAYGSNKNILTSGGRVLSVVCTGETLEEAVKKAYENAAEIKFDNRYYRKDIAYRALKEQFN